jgi:hypothetical protein
MRSSRQTALDVVSFRFDGIRIHDSLALNGFNLAFCVPAGKLVLSIERVNGRMKVDDAAYFLVLLLLEPSSVTICTYVARSMCWPAKLFAAHDSGPSRRPN